jgi:hypothetical protein
MGPLPDDLGAVPWIPLAQAPKEETSDDAAPAALNPAEQGKDTDNAD